MQTEGAINTCTFGPSFLHFGVYTTLTVAQMPAKHKPQPGSPADASTRKARSAAYDEDPVICLASTALVLTIYIWTLPPSVVGGDSGEIVVAAWTLVFAHPPGYPLITLVGHVFCHYILPIGEPAWRMGVLNAVFGAATFALLVRSLQQLTDCTVCAVFTSQNS